MTLNQLRNVIAVADTGSMNEAAKQLYIAQPSLSQSVKELEKEIGAELFRRGNRGVVLTVEGEEFLSYARQVVQQYELMENRYVEKKNVKKKFEKLRQILPRTLKYLDLRCAHALGILGKHRHSIGNVIVLILTCHCVGT